MVQDASSYDTSSYDASSCDATYSGSLARETLQSMMQYE